MNAIGKILTAATLLALAAWHPAQASNSLTVSGTLFKKDNGTTFDTWKLKILGIGSFTVDVAAYEASQSKTTDAGYYTHDINGDGELTWLDPDTYFYKNTGSPLAATDALVRCDDVANNCAVYQNGLTSVTSPIEVTTHLQSEAAQDGSIHFRRDPWFQANVKTAGDYLFLIADYRLDPAEAVAGINGKDSFSAPTGFTKPILDHADYRISFSSQTMAFSLDGDTISVRPVPLPGAVWLFASAIVSLISSSRRRRG